MLLANLSACPHVGNGDAIFDDHCHTTEHMFVMLQCKAYNHTGRSKALCIRPSPYWTKLGLFFEQTKSWEVQNSAKGCYIPPWSCFEDNKFMVNAIVDHVHKCSLFINFFIHYSLIEKHFWSCLQFNDASKPGDAATSIRHSARCSSVWNCESPPYRWCILHLTSAVLHLTSHRISSVDMWNIESDLLTSVLTSHVGAMVEVTTHSEAFWAARPRYCYSIGRWAV